MKTDRIHFVTKFRTLFFCMTLLVLLASCMDDDDGLVTEPVEVAYVSIYNAAPDAPDLDIIVDGRVINRNPFDYTSYSGYLNFFTGTRDIKFSAVNANNALVDTTFNLENGKAYSLFAVNVLPNVEALLVVDSAAAPASGKAMVRFVNLSPDASAFEVSAAEGASSLSFSQTPFKHATAFSEVDADTYTFEVKNAGSSDVIIKAEDVEIRPGRYYTIITRGFVSAPAGNNNLLSVEVLD